MTFILCQLYHTINYPIMRTDILIHTAKSYKSLLSIKLIYIKMAIYKKMFKIRFCVLLLKVLRYIHVCKKRIIQLYID